MLGVWWIRPVLTPGYGFMAEPQAARNVKTCIFECAIPNDILYPIIAILYICDADMIYAHEILLQLI